MSTVRYLADHDLRSDIVLAVCRLEPAIEFRVAREFGLAAVADNDILHFAAREGFVVVSHDVSTMKAVAMQRVANGLGMKGLFLIPQDRPTRIASESLRLVWAASTAEEWNEAIAFLPI